MPDTPLIDAYSPAQISARVSDAGLTKGNMDLTSTFTLAIAAGVFIALGAALYTFVTHDSTLSVGLTKLIGGLVFCLGLILVVVAGAELFTGNNLLVMAYVGRKITLVKLLKNWTVVFAGNFVGALLTVSLVWMAGMFEGPVGTHVGAAAVGIARHKVNLTFMQALASGVLCNMLVCLAVWLCFGGRSVVDKVIAILFPITAFVALGFEHSVANMYFVPAGIMAAQSVDVMTAFGGAPETLGNLTVQGFLLHNLLPVTLGNIIGGGFFVASIYWFVYQRRAAAEPIRPFMTEGPPRVAPGTLAAEAVQVMKQTGSGCVLVGTPEQAVGIVSERDIVQRVLAEDKSTTEATVDDIMSTPLVSVDIRTPIKDMYRTLTDRGIRHLMITEKGKQVGFVSVKDLLKKPII